MTRGRSTITLPVPREFAERSPNVPVNLNSTDVEVKTCQASSNLISTSEGMRAPEVLGITVTIACITETGQYLSTSQPILISFLLHLSIVVAISGYVLVGGVLLCKHEFRSFQFYDHLDKLKRTRLFRFPLFFVVVITVLELLTTVVVGNSGSRKMGVDTLVDMFTVMGATLVVVVSVLELDLEERGLAEEYEENVVLNLPLLWPSTKVLHAVEHAVLMYRCTQQPKAIDALLSDPTRDRDALLSLFANNMRVHPDYGEWGLFDACRCCCCKKQRDGEQATRSPSQIPSRSDKKARSELNDLSEISLVDRGV